MRMSKKQAMQVALHQGFDLGLARVTQTQAGLVWCREGVIENTIAGKLLRQGLLTCSSMKLKVAAYTAQACLHNEAVDALSGCKLGVHG